MDLNFHVFEFSLGFKQQTEPQSSLGLNVVTGLKLDWHLELFG